MRRLAIALPLVLLTPGCSFLLSTVRGALEGSGGGSALVENEHARGRTGSRGSHRPISCGAAQGSPQNVYTFVAPRSATYVFDSTTSDYDGVIAVYDPSTGAELACNDDHQSTRASEVTVDLTEGQIVEVIQGGYSGASGSYDLWVSGGPAVATASSASEPPRPLAPGATVTGDTRFHQAIAGLDCPPASPMQEWTFTPPEDGSFLFQVQADYDAYLAIAPEGSTTSIACNDDTGDTAHSQVAVDLSAGTAYRVIVGGFSSQSGTYQLSATPLSSGGALSLGQPLFFANGTSDSEPDVCGAAPGSLDRTFTFRPPADAFYVIHTDAPGWLVVSDGHRILTCVAIASEHRVGIALKPGHTYEIVVEMGSGSVGAHYISVERSAPDAPDWQGQGGGPVIDVGGY